MRYLLLAVAALGAFGPLRAADAVTLPKELAAVPNDALGFFTVNLTPFRTHPATGGPLAAFAKLPQAAEAPKVIGLKVEEIERITAVLLPPSEQGGNRRTAEPETVLLITAKAPIDQAQVIKALQLYGIEEAKDLEDKIKPGDKPPPPSGKTGATFYFNTQSHVMAFVGDRTVLFQEPDRLPRKAAEMTNPFDRLKSTNATGPLSEGIGLGVKHPVAFGLNLRAIKDLMAASNEPPPDDLLPLFRADAFAGFAALNKDAADVTMTLAFAGKQYAEEGEEAATKVKQLAVLLARDQGNRVVKREGKDSVLGNLALTVADAVDKAAVKRADKDVTMAGTLDLGPKTQALLAALPQASSESALVSKSANNLKQIGLAYHSHADVNGGLGVTNSQTADGKPLLSWRVHLLPHLEQAELYKQFKLDEPWDSDHNKKLIEKMPPVYALPGVKTKEAGRTFYQGFVAEKNVVGGRPLFLAGEAKGAPFPALFTDGTSNSLLCVEAADPVVWTKPDDLPFDPNGKLPKLGGHYAKDRFQAVFCDGSTRLMNAAMPEAKLKAYITINGGEVIQDD